MTFYNIEGFEHYLLGKEGDNWSVWRIKKNGKLKKVEGTIDGSGHIRYTLHTDNGKHVTKRLHQLIAEQFIPIPKELLESGEPLHVHHRDHNALNNSLSNLCWLTASKHHRLHMEGEKNPFYGKHHSEESRRKISEIKKGKHRPLGAGTPPKKVYQLSLDGELVAVWPSTAECGRKGFNQGGVAACCRGERKTHKGYRWSYQPL